MTTMITRRSLHVDSLLYFFSVIEFLQQYGWFVLFGFVVLIYIKVKLDPHIRRVKKKAEDVIEQKKFGK